MLTQPPKLHRCSSSSNCKLVHKHPSTPESNLWPDLCGPHLTSYTVSNETRIQTDTHRTEMSITSFMKTNLQLAIQISRWCTARNECMLQTSIHISATPNSTQTHNKNTPNPDTQDTTLHNLAIHNKTHTHTTWHPNLDTHIHNRTHTHNMGTPNPDTHDTPIHNRTHTTHRHP